MRELLVNRRDLIVAQIAARQHGVVTTRQLRDAGFDKSAVTRGVASGRLHRVHRGVYAVGHSGLTRKGLFKAATLACGERAVLSHISAAELWGMLPESSGLIHVSVPVGGGRARRHGVRVHRRRLIAERRVMGRDNIPVSSPADTLADLRGTIPSGDLRQAVREAEILGLPIDPFELVPDRAASDLELDFLALCRRGRVRSPEVNVWIGRDRVDFLWRRELLIVETDSYRYHRGSVAFEDDRAKQSRLMARGFDVLRFTYWQVANEPGEVLRVLRARLQSAGDQARGR